MPITNPQTSNWALHKQERQVIEEFLDQLVEMLPKREREHFHNINFQEHLDTYYGVNRKQLEKERADLLKTAQENARKLI